ncbi:hypothetical protein VOI54_04725 [Tamlana sp. 2201CG12-4]|uniref:hypothetical protein n=1 Tax=Tamlana sp. 2201CG12-4 TaxID=3112582 RepID=UPI002DBC8544|nr:hypothetical protein [Tamlana sp. 2201CG12-4]MEC3906309.1 hypothetical protein [Tamlana sp. 2201CG12-4]
MSLKKKIYDSSPIFLQNILVSIKGYKKFKIRYRNELKNEIIKESQNNSETLKKLQTQKLKSYLEEAKNNSDYWKDIISQEFIDDFKLENLKTLPIITKNDIIQNKSFFVNKETNSCNNLILSTSGTSGAGFNFLISKKAVSIGFTLFWQDCYHQNRFGDKYATFNGNIIVSLKQKNKPFWRFNRAFNQTIFSVFHMNDKNLLSYYAKLKKGNYMFVNGYPSAIYHLAEFILNKNLPPLKVKAIYTSSESLYIWQRITIEKAFSSKIYDLYSNAEQTVLAYQGEDSKYKVSPLFSYVWFKETDVMIENEKAYKVIGTNFNNDAMFFINYDTNDLVLLDKKGEIKKVIGRQEDVIVLVDGTKIGRLDHLFKEAEDVKAAQIIQNDYDNIIIRVVLREEVFKSKEGIIKQIRNRISKEMKISFEIVERIEKNQNGKYKFVISNLKNKEI